MVGPSTVARMIAVQISARGPLHSKGEKEMIVYDHNSTEACICEKCQAGTQIYKTIENITIQGRNWIVTVFHCDNCFNNWIVWDGECPVGGDIEYRYPYTWEINADAA